MLRAVRPLRSSEKKCSRFPELSVRRKNSNDCRVGAFHGNLFNGAFEGPSAPVEADDYRRDSPGRRALQEAFERVALQE